MPWLKALMKASAYPHPTGKIEHLHTHISDVFLTGKFAYKVKKAVDLKFLDFSSLEKRKFFCEREVALNRRLAQDIYLGVVPITVDNGAVRVGGKGEVIEYAVKMVQFDQKGLLNAVAKRGELTADHMRTLAGQLAGFHRSALCDEGYGHPRVVGEHVLGNFKQTEKYRGIVVERDRFDRLREFSEMFLEEHTAGFEERMHRGAIRICHGDLHLRNICLDRDRLIIFDCIEFNEALSHIDVISEAAFLMMDLDHRGLHGLGNVFFNTYLDETQDYPGLSVLDFYLIYRAMVRAKVAVISLDDPDMNKKEKREAGNRAGAYFELAHRYLMTHDPRLIIMAGVSGSGKSTVAQDLSRAENAVVIRSDVLRKHIAGIELDTRAGGQGGYEEGIYTHEMTERTYAGLLKAAEAVVESGRWAILDATFGNSDLRRAALEWAEKKEIPFTIIHCSAPVPELESRLVGREARGVDASDAGVAVMRRQLSTFDPIEPFEETFTLTLHTEQGWDAKRIARKVRKPHSHV
ncbi:MAG TPA: AAA family ATPase [Nitrospiria bacterium]